MTERPQVNVALDPEVKSEWEEYVSEHPEYSYVSHLVRAAVGKEIRGEYGGSGSGPDGERLSDMESTLLNIQSTLEDMDDRMLAVERGMEEPSEDIQELSNEVFAVLPTETELQQEQHSAIPDEDTPVVVDGVVQTGAIGDIAEHLNEGRIYVRQAIEELQENTSLVGTKLVDGEERYFKEV